MNANRKYDSDVNSIVVIPARKNSKRLKGKNTKKLGGIPLVEYSINYAKKNSHIIDDIVVTSDDERVEEISQKLQVKFFKRSANLSNDFTPTSEVLKDVLKQYNKSVEYVILLQPTSPLRPKWLLQRAWSVVQEKKIDSLMTVSRSNYKLGKIVNNEFRPFNYTFGQRSQELDPLYYENGLLYITKSNSILINNEIITENVYPFIVDHPFGKIDIDTAEDFELAQYYLKKYAHESYI